MGDRTPKLPLLDARELLRDDPAEETEISAEHLQLALSPLKLGESLKLEPGDALLNLLVNLRTANHGRPVIHQEVVLRDGPPWPVRRQRLAVDCSLELAH